MDNYCKVVKIGYCSLQYLLYFQDRIGYTGGTYGWNADVYDFGSIAIVTGYRPFGNIDVPYDKVQEYENYATQYMESYKMTYEEKRDAINKLLEKFIKEVISA